MHLRARRDDVAFALYAKNHRLPTVMIGMAVTVVVQVLVGVQRIQLPNSDVVFPYRKLLPIGLALSVLCLLTSDVIEQESMAARDVKNVTRRVTAVVAGAAAAVETLQGCALSSLDEGITCARAVLVWMLLGLLAGALGSPRGVWMLPLATVVPFTYLDPFVDEHPAWWNVPLTPASSPGGWVFLGVLGAVLFIVARVQGTDAFRRRITPLV